MMAACSKQPVHSHPSLGRDSPVAKLSMGDDRAAMLPLFCVRSAMCRHDSSLKCLPGIVPIPQPQMVDPKSH